MNVYQINSVEEQLKGNPYVGRGIIIGESADGKNAVFAYFIMGRSENSRNRVFVKEGDNLVTRPFDPSKVEDPSLIIYSAVRSCGNNVIVTNGDQTDTVYDYVSAGKTFEQALLTREFEPDAPNLTPRISGMLTFGDKLTYKISILKSEDESGSECARYTYDYSAMAGLGHFIHTYITDGNPLPTFAGEPERVAVPSSMDEFAQSIWESLDSDNKISLYVRYTDLATGKMSDKLINKHG